jgi:uncharacterized protein (DUF488 family)
METLLCTIGFAGKTAEEFFALLAGAGVEKVIDIREHRDGQLSGFAKHPDLAFFLDRVAHIGYAHEAQLAPTPELLKGYRESHNWPAYEAAFLSLMKDRGVPQSVDTRAWPCRIALLCSEPGPEKCHRRLVADLLAERWRAEGRHVEIRHLLAAQRENPKRKAKKQTAVP